MLQVDTDYKDYTEHHKNIQFELEWDKIDCSLLSGLTCREVPYVLSACCKVLLCEKGIRIVDNRNKYYKAKESYEKYCDEVYWNIIETVL